MLEPVGDVALFQAAFGCAESREWGQNDLLVVAPSTEEGDGGVEIFFENGPVGQYQLANHVVLAVLLFPREGQLPGGTSGVVVLLHIFCYFL